MRILIVGLGTQGLKRIKNLPNKFDSITLDPYSKLANFKNIKDISDNDYDTVFICTPDNTKINYLSYFIRRKKNILIEKPLNLDTKILKKLKNLAKKNKIICYTAYNHRFEPHIIKLKSIIQKKTLGKIYHCRIFYGNGTATLIKNSSWKNSIKGGIIPDIGSHLLDLIIYLFGNEIKSIKLTSANKHENKFYDFANILIKTNSNINIELSMTYCMWMNDFNLDIIGSKGSAHIHTLVKWGPSNLQIRKRIFPSGRPKLIYNSTIYGKDPTWRSEHKYFMNIINKKQSFKSFENDIFIKKYLNKII